MYLIIKLAEAVKINRDLANPFRKKPAKFRAWQHKK